MSIVATLSSEISASFKSFTLLSWVAEGYLIANSAFQPLSGRLTDIYGRKAGVIFACTFFSLGTLMCGFATSSRVLIAGRLIAGMGGGCVNTVSVFIMTDLVPLRQRGLWQGIGNLVWGSGMATGGVLGGVIAESLGWRWAFHIQVPFIILAGLLSSIFVNIPPKESDKSKIKRVDFAGALTLSVSLVLLLLALNSGGNVVPWSHPLVYVSLPVALIILLGFIYIEANVAAEPIIPVRLLLHRTVISALLANWFNSMVALATIYYAPIYFNAVQHLSSAQAGLRLVPMALGASVGSLSAGLAMRVTGKYWTITLLAGFGGVIATTLIAIFFRPGLALWVPFPLLGFQNICYAATITTTFLALLASVSHEDQAVITSASYAFRSTGSTIGITLAGAVFQNILSKGLWAKFGDVPGAAEVIGRLRDDVEEVKHLGPRWKKGVEEVYADALRGVWGLLIGLSVLGAICGMLMREHKLHTTIKRK